MLLCVGAIHSQDNHPNKEPFFESENIVSDSVSVVTEKLQKQIDGIEVHFRHDNHLLDFRYMGNDESLRRFSDKIDSIGLARIDSLVIISRSSPEGSYLHNVNLSKKRAATMRDYILTHHAGLSDRLHVHADGESWGRLREYVKNDTLMKQSTIDKVLEVIDADVSIDTKKWRMQRLAIYRYLLQTYYRRIRNSTFFILYYEDLTLPLTPCPVVSEPVSEISEERPESIPAAPVAPSPLEPWCPKLHIKTNLVGLCMAVSNIAVEVDLAGHWSLALPVCYSAWDYFKSTIKFRTFAVQPELRYWLSERNDGFFAGAHIGLAYYNVALDGDYRYQDHNRETPAIGGGVSMGYRMPISRNNRWRMEFSLGAGVYPLHYDKFHNTPRTKDGLMIESRKKTYWGIDQAAVSLSYSFDLKKKGGAK